MSKPDAGWERLFWLIFERSSNPIALVDEAGRIVEVNDAALELFHRGHDELVGTSVLDVVPRSGRDDTARRWRAFLRSGYQAGAGTLVRGDGSEVEVDFAGALAGIGEGRLAVYVMLPGARPWGCPDRPGAVGQPLTKREREVVTLIALGRDTGQIARELHIASETVRTHVRNAMSKLKARTRAQLVAIALCTDATIHLPQLQQ
jgi:PAS domain S-box-containing protein